jgi:hypothetical protein
MAPRTSPNYLYFNCPFLRLLRLLSQSDVALNAGNTQLRGNLGRDPSCDAPYFAKLVRISQFNTPRHMLICFPSPDVFKTGKKRADSKSLCLISGVMSDPWTNPQGPSWLPVVDTSLLSQQFHSFTSTCRTKL